MPDKFPKQSNNQTPPGTEDKMQPKPYSDDESYKGSNKLQNKVAIITGADSGIGKAVAIAYAKEGADVAIIYLSDEEDKDAQDTKTKIEQEGGKCILIRGDIGDEKFCTDAVEKTVKEFGHLDILVNNAAEQHPQKSIEDITEEQLSKTFRTNIFGMFFMTKAAINFLKEGSAIINTTSVTAYKGSPQLLDYSSTKGAIEAFTYSLSMSLAEKKIRVNGVAPGPIWTPLIPSTFPDEKVETFGADTPMKRAGQPKELAPTYIFLASNDMSSYISGQIIHVNGGTVVHG